MAGQVLLVSGPRSAGKTTLIRKSLDMLASRQLDLAGILSLPVVEQGLKIAIDALDLRSAETRRLAVHNQGRTGKLHTRQWSFDPAAMHWADGVLAKACPCDLLVVDELGVLEFERGLGWQCGLKAIDEGPYRLALVVIRPELLDQAQARWPRSQVLEVDPTDRDAAMQALNRLFEGLPR